MLAAVFHVATSKGKGVGEWLAADQIPKNKEALLIHPWGASKDNERIRRPGKKGSPGAYGAVHTGRAESAAARQGTKRRRGR